VFLLVEPHGDDPFGFASSTPVFLRDSGEKRYNFLQSGRATRSFGLRIFLADVVCFQSATVDQFIG